MRSCGAVRVGTFRCMTVRTRLLGVLSVVCLVAIVALTIPFVTTSTILGDVQRSIHAADQLRPRRVVALLHERLDELHRAVAGPGPPCGVTDALLEVVDVLDHDLDGLG